MQGVFEYFGVHSLEVSDSLLWSPKGFQVASKLLFWLLKESIAVTEMCPFWSPKGIQYGHPVTQWGQFGYSPMV